MSNTVWNQWYHQNRFLGKPNPFINNYPKRDINKKIEDNKESKLEKTTKTISIIVNYENTNQ